MKNRYIVLTALLAAGFLLFAGAARAQMPMMGGAPQGASAETGHGPDIEQVLLEIRESQGLAGGEELDCAQVTDDQFEELGEAYMSLIHPDPEQHEAMDAMMGGEGSESLRLAHINMGRSYLGCRSGANAGWGNMPMMGGGYYGSPGFGTWAGGGTMILLWAFLILGIALEVKLLRKK